MPKTNRTLAYDGESIPFHLSYSKRKTLEIAVHPDCSVVVKAPLGEDETLIEDFIYKRASWIKRQIRYFAEFAPRTPKRQFVGGESHLYLGKQYRLKIRPSATDEVLLKRGFFHIQAVDDKPEHIATLLEAWYWSEAEVYFAQVFEECWQLFQKNGVDKPGLKIRKMKTLWGSFSVKRGITLNLELIKAPENVLNTSSSTSYAIYSISITDQSFTTYLSSFFPTGQNENINWKRRWLNLLKTTDFVGRLHKMSRQ